MIMLSFIALRRMESTVIILHNSAESWFAGLSSLEYSVV